MLCSCTEQRGRRHRRLLFSAAVEPEDPRPPKFPERVRGGAAAVREARDGLPQQDGARAHGPRGNSSKPSHLDSQQRPHEFQFPEHRVLDFNLNLALQALLRAG